MGLGQLQMRREPHDTQAHAYRYTHTGHTHQVRKNATARGCESARSPTRRKVEDRNRKLKTSEVSVLYLADLGWQMVQERDWQPQWLSAHVVTVVLVTALKFFLLLFPHLRKY